MDDMPQLLEIGEVASLMKCHRNTVRKEWYEGRIPAPVRIGSRSIRWRAGDIRQALLSRQPVERTECE